MFGEFIEIADEGYCLTEAIFWSAVVNNHFINISLIQQGLDCGLGSGFGEAIVVVGEDTVLLVVFDADVPIAVVGFGVAVLGENLVDVSEVFHVVSPFLVSPDADFFASHDQSCNLASSSGGVGVHSTEVFPSSVTAFVDLASGDIDHSAVLPDEVPSLDAEVFCASDGAVLAVAVTVVVGIGDGCVACLLQLALFAHYDVVLSVNLCHVVFSFRLWGVVIFDIRWGRV